MTDPTLLGAWVRRFLLEHLAGERNLARNTRLSYRDAFRLLLPFAARLLNKAVDRLSVVDISADLVRQFLADLEDARRCLIATRNQRLAALHAFARFVGEHSPEHVAWCGQIRSVPFKNTTRPAIAYLDKSEMDALLAATDRHTAQGPRDYTLMLFLYNSGARADEAARLLINAVDLASASVKIVGKGAKQRQCPLWSVTVRELRALTGGRSPAEHVFLNRRGAPLTRFGIHTLIER